MNNKAGIVSGIVLISILVIGLGVYIYNVAASGQTQVDLSSQEAMAQNTQFTSYFGDNRSSAEVKSLMAQISSNNITGQTSDESRKIYVIFNGEITTPSTVIKNVKSGTKYWIGTLNDEAVSSSEEFTKVETADETTPAYYSNGYLRIICVNQGGAPAGIE